MHSQVSTALQVSMDVWNRNATEATKHMLIVMAQSAAAATPQAKRTRPVLRDDHGEYVVVYKQNRGHFPVYKWMAEGKNKSWDRLQNIRNRGLAKRSWLWGLKAGSKPIAGTSRVDPIRSGARMVGWQKTNSLGYIDKIMPSGYQQEAEQKAINKVMKLAEMKMVREFEREIGRVAA